MDPFVEGSYPDACVPGYTPASLTVARADIAGLNAAVWCPAKQGYVGDEVMRSGGYFGPEYANTHNQKDTYESGETPNPYTEWIEVAIDEPVYVFRIVIGMPRGPGCIVAIRVLNPESGEWVRLYEGPPLLDVFRDKKEANEYWRWAPNVCQIDFKADTLRIEMDTSSETGIYDWNYVDYVEVFGSREIQPHVLGVNGHIGDSSDRGFKVLYVANEHANGEDSFEYTGNDCLGDLFRASEPGVVTISIASRNDAPVQLMGSVDVVRGTTLTLYLDELVQDVETPVYVHNNTHGEAVTLHVAITAMPSGASVTDGGVLIDGAAALPHNVTSTYLTLHFSDAAWPLLEEVPDEMHDMVVQTLKTATLQFEAVDESSATLHGSLHLRVLDPKLTCYRPNAVVEYAQTEPTCVACAVGTFAVDSLYCSTCGDYATTRQTGGASALDCVCQEGYYRTDALTPSTFCEPCPPLALCPLDTTVATLQLRPGVWRPSNRTSELLKCHGRPDDCSCLGQNYGAAALNNISEPWGPNTYGSTCATAWDEPSCAGKDLSDPSNAWCLSKWCYVTDKECPGALPTVFLNESAYGGILYYSYEQCGSIDFFKNNASSLFESPCIGGVDVGNSSGLGDGYGYCKPDHFGPRCEACVTGSYFDADENMCTECPKQSAVVGYVVVGLLGATALLVLFEALLSRPPKRLANLSRALKRIEHSLGGALSSLGGVAKLKILVGFVQVWTVMPSLYEVEMPDKINEWFSSFTKIFALDIDDLYPSACFGSMQKMILVNTIAPLLFALIILLVSLLWSALQRMPTSMRERCNGLVGRVAPRNVRPSQDLVPYALSLAIPPVLLLIFVVAPSVSRSLFQVWACERVRFEDGTSSGYGVDVSMTTPAVYHFYLKRDIAMRCDGSEYNTVTATALGLLLIWPCSALLLFSGLLFAARDAIVTGRPSELARNIGVLHREYRPNVHWWEVLEFARRLLLTGGLIVLVPQRNAALRLIFATFVSLAYLALQLIVQPYKRDLDNSLGAFAALALCATFLSAVFVRVAIELGREASLRVLGLESSYSFAVLMIIVMLALMILTIAALTWRAISVARAAAHAQAELDALKAARGRMNNPPTCKWETSKGFCAFLSHYKEEAGSDARYLSDLMTLMAHCPVFLDSANLCDLRLLYSDGVHKSDTMVVLATSEYATPRATRHTHSPAPCTTLCMLPWVRMRCTCHPWRGSLARQLRDAAVVHPRALGGPPQADPRARVAGRGAPLRSRRRAPFRACARGLARGAEPGRACAHPRPSALAGRARPRRAQGCAARGACITLLHTRVEQPTCGACVILSSIRRVAGAQAQRSRRRRNCRKRFLAGPQKQRL